MAYKIRFNRFQRTFRIGMQFISMFKKNHGLMRKKLAADEGERKKFRATFDRIGKKINFRGYSEETILLNSITDAEKNEVVTDHIWFTYTKGFQKLTLTKGDVIAFEARVKLYSKGYVNRKYKINKQKTDYTLSHPTKIKHVDVADT